ncbi:hypothetical protein ACHAXS_013093 [Conticribra weissflogii]
MLGKDAHDVNAVLHYFRGPRRDLILSPAFVVDCERFHSERSQALPIVNLDELPHALLPFLLASIIHEEFWIRPVSIELVRLNLNSSPFAMLMHQLLLLANFHR